MICENCGARIGKGKSYCPKCGNEVYNSGHKPLKNKYLRGEYLPNDESSAESYYLEEETISPDTNQKEPHQNWDDYDKDPYEDYNQNKDDNKINNQNTDYNHEYGEKSEYTPYEDDKVRNQNYDHDKSYKKGRDPEMGYDKGYDKKYNKKGYNKKYDRDRGYDKGYNKNKGYKGNYNPESSHKKGKPVRRGYDLDAYYGTQEKKSSIWKTVILFLVLALLMGLVMGFIFFSAKLQNLI
jgi:hypothetical protein